MTMTPWRLWAAGTCSLPVFALAVAARTQRSGKPPDTQACTPESARAAAPAGVTIGPINDLNPKLPRVPTGALLVRATGDTPSYCLVTGSIVTNPSTGKTCPDRTEVPDVPTAKDLKPRLAFAKPVTV